VSINAEAPVSFVTAELSYLKCVDICLSGDDSRDVTRVSALCDSGAEICVANSSVVEGLNLDPTGQIQLRPFCRNTVTADSMCLNISLHESDVPNVTANQVVKVTCAVVSDLYDKFILTANVIDRLSRCEAVVNQAQLNDVSGAVNSPADDNRDDVNDDVAGLSSPVANDDVTVMVEQTGVECDNLNEDCDDVTDGGVYPRLIVVYHPRPKWPRNSAMTRLWLVVGN